MTNNLADEIRAYNIWVNTFETTPENFVKWRQLNDLWQLVADVMGGKRPDSDIEDWWTENTDD